MNFVQPIRSEEKIKELRELLKKNSARDGFLLNFGVNTGLRISDILPLKVSDVRGKQHLVITEKKTGKRKRFKLNQQLQEAIKSYTKGMDDDEYLFASSKRPKPITRVRAYQILNGTARKIGLSEVGTHTLRKTFGYHFYQRTRDIATLQMIFNHSHPAITLRYIGITQDLIDEAVDGFSL
ncbi:site-specific integrase [Brevibacillus borstelensis]|uniref:site-specific integrase n=1 Tax=Brevibacillus borstelensis TaxID=45462 RepID=UPI000F096389|nr:site-specific integrase [Brevibacillus borstelensis]MED1885920.1 site-specific integrase [Brevibacillus borstelensis]RNB56638.1 site-specific integrase [Brevibacillus borstelensis]GED55756.1 putative integrase/recombinase YoeC [Brevibacillus borstelensis]